MLNDLMNFAHGVTTTIPSQVKKKVEAPKKPKVTMHEPSPSYTIDYMVSMDHNGKIMVKYVGAYTKKAIVRSVWVPKVYPSNLQGPKSFWVPKFQA
jgi:hypothetical protein